MSQKVDTARKKSPREGLLFHSGGATPDLRRRMRGWGWAAGVALLVALAIPGLAAAAPPSNDTVDGAIEIMAGMFRATIDTTEATTDEIDAQVRGYCGDPPVAMEASAWFKISGGETGALRSVDVTASDYNAWLLLLVGTPGTGRVPAVVPVVWAYSWGPGSRPTSWCSTPLKAGRTVARFSWSATTAARHPRRTSRSTREGLLVLSRA